MKLSTKLLIPLGAVGLLPIIQSDDFTTGLSAIWTAAIGTYNTNAGKARAATIAVDGNEILTQNAVTIEFTSATTGWNDASGAVLTRRDYTSSPDIDPTGGADNFGMEVAHGTAATGYAAKTTMAIVKGVTYYFSCRAYSPSANTQANAASIWFNDGDAPASRNATTEDAWETLSNTRLASASATTGAMRLYCLGTTLGDMVHYDAINLQAQAAILTSDPAVANTDITVKVTMPGSGVKPFGIIARYADAANYWLWRIKPGTAGADFELVKVAAGIQSIEASADIDWTAGTEYTLRLKHYSTHYSGSVDGTEKIAHTDSTNHNTTETLFGLYDAGATNGLFDAWEVRQSRPF